MFTDLFVIAYDYRADVSVLYDDLPRAWVYPSRYIGGLTLEDADRLGEQFFPTLTPEQESILGLRTQLLEPGVYYLCNSHRNGRLALFTRDGELCLLYKNIRQFFQYTRPLGRYSVP